MLLRKIAQKRPLAWNPTFEHNANMKRSRMFAFLNFLFLAICLTNIGCSPGVSSNSPYTGKWTGTWYNSTSKEGGDIDMNISIYGVITGDIDTGSFPSFSVYGTVYDNGNMSFTYTNSNTSEFHTVSGKFSMKNGDIEVNASESINSGLSQSISMTIKPK